MTLEPLTLTVGQPLRVAVYNSISRAIRNGTYALGSVLPSDAEFCASLGVSRPVVREAMLLLEEDRLISTRRGVGRFVSHALPRVGLERVRGLEFLIGDPAGPVTVDRLSHEMQQASDLLSWALGLDASAAVWTWESVLRRGGRAIALAFEAVPASVSSAFADPASDSMPGASALTRLLSSVDPSQVSSACDVSVGVLGDHRADALGVDPDTSALILTQRVSYRGAVVLFAKSVVLSEAGTISLQQSA
ncbi:MAG: GntR family transcriptional regulator [Microbacterium sp.]|uniref:GntR family transcriptional regulator n=1 Tax=unclassified Microbacterium TaxID=2609290 RepID=UPI0025E42373|nr:GntR family transcriptional regulator [Microbacterium sp. UBA837]|tara:strand:+ start:241 stop:984 length:744 start_codon:yes stop_codon:yes gene_type:complete